MMAPPVRLWGRPSGVPSGPGGLPGRPLAQKCSICGSEGPAQAGSRAGRLPQNQSNSSRIQKGLDLVDSFVRVAVTNLYQLFGVL